MQLKLILRPQPALIAESMFYTLVHDLTQAYGNPPLNVALS